MNTDSAFYTGKTHSVCEDFTRTKNGDKPYAILCDGCSGSPDTDTGARLLALATERTFATNDEFPYGDFKSIVITTAVGMATSCGLKTEALDATLLVAAPYIEDVKLPPPYIDFKEFQQKPCIRVSIYGDGVVAVKHKDGSIRIHSVEYTRGYPYYLTYHFDKKRGAAWKKVAIDSPTGESTTIVGTTHILKPDWTVDEEMKVSSAHSSVRPFTVSAEGNSVGAAIDEVEWVAMMSDGVHTFREKSSEPGVPNRQISLIEVLKDLLDFRAFNGEFVQRQANWFMREASKRNWQHDDDVSVAAFYLG